MDAEVVERRRASCSSASHRRSSAAMRPSNHPRSRLPSVRSGVAVSPSRPSASGGRAALVRRRRGMVKLVDDRPRRSASGASVARSPVQRLDDAKTWPQASAVRRRPSSSPKRPSWSTARNVALALLQDLLAVRDEEQASYRLRCFAEPAVVECRDDGLAGAGRGDDQVVPGRALPLDLELLEDLSLVRIGRDDRTARDASRRCASRRSRLTPCERSGSKGST